MKRLRLWRNYPMIDKIEQIVPCQVGATSAAAYAIITIKDKD